MSKRNHTRKRRKGFNSEAIQWARDEWAGHLPTRLRAVLLDLATRTNHESPTCFQKQQTLSDALRISRMTLSKDLKALRSLGLVSWARRKNTSNLYTLHLDVKPDSGCKAQSLQPGCKAQGLQPGCKHHIDSKNYVTPIEVPIENKTDGVDHRTAPSACASQEKNKIEEEQRKGKIVEAENKIIPFPQSTEDSFAHADFYEWTGVDDKAAQAFVWHDLYANRAKGQSLRRTSPIGAHEPLDEKTDRLLQASKLAGDHAVASTKSAKARVRFWHKLGRLFHPHLPRFSETHELSNPQSKILNTLFDDLGAPACYVLAHVMANWDSGGKCAPALTSLEGQADVLYESWLKVFGTVVLPPTKRAYDLAGRRYRPQDRNLFDDAYQSLVLAQVAANVPVDDSEELVFVSGPK